MNQKEKSQATRQKIIEVSARLFLEKGFDKTSMRDIVEGLGMSKGAIYHQFASKEEIMQAVNQMQDEMIQQQIEAIKEQDFRKIADLMGNVLETVTIPAHPIIQEIKDFMMTEGAVNAMMSGSGPTVFGLFEDKQLAEKACEKLRESRLAKMVFLTTFIGQNPYA